MATTYKVLGQTKVATGGTPVALYTATPTGSTIQTIVSTITVCNTNTTSSTYRIAVVPSATTQSDAQAITTLGTDLKYYLVYDAIVAPKETVSYTIGLTVDTYDKILVNSGTAGVIFAAFGSETQ
jgi:hypothetical protein